MIQYSSKKKIGKHQIDNDLLWELNHKDQKDQEQYTVSHIYKNTEGKNKHEQIYTNKTAADNCCYPEDSSVFEDGTPARGSLPGEKALWKNLENNIQWPAHYVVSLYRNIKEPRPVVTCKLSVISRHGHHTENLKIAENV